jgi:hypothetical protein
MFSHAQLGKVALAHNGKLVRVSFKIDGKTFFLVGGPSKKLDEICQRFGVKISDEPLDNISHYYMMSRFMMRDLWTELGEQEFIPISEWLTRPIQKKNMYWGLNNI